MQAIPEIQRRVKSNARRLKLRIEQHQVYLTTPPNTPEAKIQAFLKESEPWLIHTWNKNYAATAGGLTPVDGEKIDFPILQQAYRVSLDYSKDHGAHKDKPAIREKIRVQEQQLIVEPDQAGSLLKAWIRAQASMALPAQLQQLAQQHGFAYQGCQVRHAKTRWGSCSSQKSISLNAALLLLPVELVNYVLLHELCHTRQLNHSARFWQEMFKVDPDYVYHRQQLKQVKLPAWWHAS